MHFEISVKFVAQNLSIRLQPSAISAALHAILLHPVSLLCHVNYYINPCSEFFSILLSPSPFVSSVENVLKSLVKSCRL